VSALGLAEELARLDRLSVADLRTEWQRVLKAPAPAISPDLLTRGIAYELQVRRHGGLPRSVRREIERLGQEVQQKGGTPRPRASLMPGTRLARDWHGRTHHVLVLDDGFLFEDRRYRSLTQIARAITGAVWSGPRFFGLTSEAANAA
jgi:hypothetical protein